MDLDELKERTRSVKAPAFASGSETAGSIDDLISRMRASDARDTQTVRRWRTVLIIGGAAYTLLFTLTWIFPPDGDPGFHRVLFALTALLLLGFARIVHRKHRSLGGVDYNAGARTFLEEATSRYRFIRPKDLTFSIPYALALITTSGVGWTNAMHRYMPSWSDTMSIMVFAGLLCVSALFGLVVARRDWHTRKEPILNELCRLKEELTRTFPVSSAAQWEQPPTTDSSDPE